jgi:hypothetical protein
MHEEIRGPGVERHPCPDWLSPHAGTLRGGVGGGGPPLTLSAAFALGIRLVYEEQKSHGNHVLHTS